VLKKDEQTGGENWAVGLTIFFKFSRSRSVPVSSASISRDKNSSPCFESGLGREMNPNGTLDWDIAVEWWKGYRVSRSGSGKPLKSEMKGLDFDKE